MHARYGRVFARHRRPALLSLTRLIGEQSGLSALADKSSIVRRHDPFAPAGVGDTVVEAYAPWGFTVSGAALEGPVLLLPRAAFLFSPQQPDHLTPEALAVLDLLDQPVSMLVMGCGRRSRRVPAAIRAWLEQRDCAVEALTTAHACSMFNFMAQEQRAVAAVLWPIEDLVSRERVREQDEVQAAIARELSP
jgi:uncharacterized protein